MKIDSIRYSETIKSNKLIYDKLIIDRILGVFSVFLPTAFLLFFFNSLFPEILSNEPKEMDYILAFLLPSITLVIGLYMIVKVIQRNTLKELDYSVDFKKAKELIFDTADMINWKLVEKNQNVIIFKTDRDPLMYKQEITLIITPDKKILFNSSPGKDFGDAAGLQTLVSYYRARFFDNYTNFQANFKRLEGPT